MLLCISSTCFIMFQLRYVVSGDNYCHGSGYPPLLGQDIADIV